LHSKGAKGDFEKVFFLFLTFFSSLTNSTKITLTTATEKTLLEDWNEPGAVLLFPPLPLPF
jgi:hypothetical protein